MEAFQSCLLLFILGALSVDGEPCGGGGRVYTTKATSSSVTSTSTSFTSTTTSFELTSPQLDVRDQKLQQTTDAPLKFAPV